MCMLFFLDYLYHLFTKAYKPNESQNQTVYHLQADNLLGLQQGIEARSEQ